VNEIIHIIKLANWIFRGLDFNADAMAENVGFRIKRILVTDDIEISLSKEDIDSLVKRSGDNMVKRESGNDFNEKNLGGTIFAEQIRKNEIKRSLDYYDYGEDEHYGRSNRPTNQTKSKRPNISRKIFSLRGDQVYKSIKQSVSKKKKLSGCCIVLVYVYHNIAPALSMSSFSE